MSAVILSGIPELLFIAAAFIPGSDTGFTALLAAVLLHELGHLVAAFLLGIRMKLCRTGTFGIFMKYDFSTASNIREAVVCFAGPLAGIVSFLICFAAGTTSPFAGASVTLAIVNLIPVSGLDGGHILSALLSFFLSPNTVWRICRTVSVISALILWCTAVFASLRANGDLSVMIVSIYLIYRLFSEY